MQVMFDYFWEFGLVFNVRIQNTDIGANVKENSKFVLINFVICRY